MSEPYIDTVKEAHHQFADIIFDNGTNSVHFEKTNSPTTKRTAEHEMICLPLPSIDDPTVWTNYIQSYIKG
jgi:hypothetical protein